MSDQPYYITPEGLKKVEKDLEYLRQVKRHQVAERLHNALAEGGELGEDAEYEDAKNEQAFVEGEIARLETILGNAQIIADTGDRNQVNLGHKVTLREKGTKNDEVYYIVGEAEADPSIGKISYKSPIGSALMGHKVKDEVKVQVPDGQLIFVVLAIE
jgi:transcription elongation factor GreA